MSNHRSFTLIELLVVIAIIGVLSAIVITSISGAITKSRIVRLQVFSDTIRAQLSDSLVSYWSFNEGTGVTAYDQWEGNNGTLVGDPEWKSGGECVSGKCLEFDGVNDYVNIIQSANLQPSAISVELWFKPLSIPNSLDRLFVYWTGYSIELDTDQKLYFRIYNGAQLDTPKSNIVTIEQWTHVIGIYNTITGLSIYIDGNHIGNTSTSGNLSYPSFTASYTSRWSSNYFHGLIDEVRIYNSAVSITQIQSQYLVGLDNLLSNGAISKSEYNQRIKELSKEIVIE